MTAVIVKLTDWRESHPVKPPPPPDPLLIWFRLWLAMWGLR